jgi:hypothetical protein
MKPGTNKPGRAYPYPSPRLVSLIRTTSSGRGWFLTDDGYPVKKPFATLPIKDADLASIPKATLWHRLLLLFRRIIRRLFR